MAVHVICSSLSLIVCLFQRAEKNIIQAPGKRLHPHTIRKEGLRLPSSTQIKMMKFAMYVLEFNEFCAITLGEDEASLMEILSLKIVRLIFMFNPRVPRSTVNFYSFNTLSRLLYIKVVWFTHELLIILTAYIYLLLTLTVNFAYNEPQGARRKWFVISEVIWFWTILQSGLGTYMNVRAKNYVLCIFETHKTHWIT